MLALLKESLSPKKIHMTITERLGYKSEGFLIYVHMVFKGVAQMATLVCLIIDLIEELF